MPYREASPRLRVKICCIASLEEAERAIGAGADALGLVAAMPSGPGVISEAAIRAIAARVPPPVAAFLLTAKTSAEAIARDLKASGAGIVQVVQPIAQAEAALLRALLPPPIRIVQVVHVEDRGALSAIDRHGAHCDAFLLDSGRPNAAIPELGGTGRPHDWAISRDFVARSPLPVFLAGGLDAGNVGEAILAVNPYGLDLCSGVRTNGRLDTAKLRDFFRAVAAARA